MTREQIRLGRRRAAALSAAAAAVTVLAAVSLDPETIKTVCAAVGAWAIACGAMRMILRVDGVR